MVIAAFAGQKTTGGCLINLVGLNQRKERIEISLSLTQPCPDCLVTQAPTQPYMLVEIAKSNRPVQIQWSTKTFSCVTGNAL